MFGKLIPWKHENRDINKQSQDHTVARMRQDFDQLWENFWEDWRNQLSQWQETRWLDSHVDFDDREKEYVLRAELPGFEPRDFDVKLSGNVLSLRAEHKEAGDGKNGEGSYRRYGSIYQSFTLPAGVLTDQIDAKYHSGVLEVRLPKSEDCQSKRIAVTAA